MRLTALKALETFCEFNRSQLGIINLKYKNPTAFEDIDQSDDWYDESIEKYMVTKRLELAPLLTLLAEIKVQPTAADPLSGLHAITGGASAIIGHTKIHEESVAAAPGSIPKLIMSTGAITEAHYSDTKAGARGKFSHQMGALIIEIEADGKTFHRRVVEFNEDGSFFDIDRLYTATRTIPIECVDSLVTGDDHVIFGCQEVKKATFTNSDSLFKVTRPLAVVRHDLLDFYGNNHHHKDDHFIKFVNHHSGVINIEAEVRQAFEHITDTTSDFCIDVIVASNHNDALVRWLKETDPRTNPENAILWSELNLHMLKNSRFGNSGAEIPDPLQYLGGKWLASNHKTVWTGRGSYKRVGVELGLHGDKGINGARSSLKSFDKLATKSIVGHSHACGRFGGVLQVGTSSRLNLGYNSGPSSWTNTHALLYKNGAMTLISIVNGNWRDTTA